MILTSCPAALKLLIQGFYVMFPPHQELPNRKGNESNLHP